MWERLKNPNYKLVEFDQFKTEANIENLNTYFIQESMEQKDRLKKLNEIAIQQMKLLTSTVKRIEE